MLDTQLFWTSDAGQSWEEIGLSIPSDATIKDVEFIDTNMGWVLWATDNIDGSANFTLAQTLDHGAIWNIQALALFDAGDISAHSEIANMGWFDAQTGWVAVKQATGSNFSLGTLFTTSNGGSTWMRSTLPIADHVFFDGPQIGWTVGGPAGDQIFQTQDGGITWQDVKSQLSSNTIAALQIRSGDLNKLKKKDKLSSSIVELDMVSLDFGWAKSIDADCVTASSLDDGSVSVSCSSFTRLLQTKDGGVTWRDVQLPFAASYVASSGLSGMDRTVVMKAIPNLGNTENFIGQGFDKCEIPSVQQMQTWWDHSPYKAVNLYIGGSSRACANSALTASYIEELHQQGWKFIPTWVGPQAPCTGYLSRMSSDVAIAYDQGVNEANLAVAKSFNLV